MKIKELIDLLTDLEDDQELNVEIFNDEDWSYNQWFITRVSEEREICWSQHLITLRIAKYSDTDQIIKPKISDDNKIQKVIDNNTSWWTDNEVIMFADREELEIALWLL